MNKKIVCFIIILFVFVIFSPTTNLCYADELSDVIKNQLDNLDFDEVENFINSLEDKLFFDAGFFEYVKGILSGKSNFNIVSVFNVFLQYIMSDIIEILPTLFAVLGVSLFCSVAYMNKSSFLSESTKDVIFFVCFATVILLVLSDVASILSKVYKSIYSLSELSQCVFPILLTLMVASGGNVSANIYTPTVAFLSTGFVSILTKFLFPLITIMLILGIVGNISKNVSLEKAHDFTVSLGKWSLGLCVTIFSFFITVQGIGSAITDGVSLRVTKYAISNSIPLIGGFLSGGFDLVLAGSVLIKNAVGVGSLFLILVITIKPILTLIVYRLLIMLFSAIIDPISDKRFTSYLSILNKTLSFLLALVIAVAFMIFVLLLLLVCSANSFI